MTTFGAFKKFTDDFEDQEKMMPALFIGHGSPMNAIEDNEFSRSWKKIGQSLPLPKAILCISAHWETRGSYVTMIKHPMTLHDFGGFPKALFEVEYPAPGDPVLAADVINITSSAIEPDMKRGLDHGSWSVLKPMYPKANIPVVQLSLNTLITPRQHYELGIQLRSFRQKGILILGSGNLVHNLGLLNWGMMDGGGFDWALEANDIIKSRIEESDIESLINYHTLGEAVSLAIPTPEHFLPMLYFAGVRGKNEKLRFFNDKAVGGSLTMTSVIIE